MKNLLFSILFCLLFNTFAPAQLTVKSFDKDGLKFDYPADWTITDKSDSAMQTLFLSKPNSTVLITISSPREVVTDRTQYRNFQNDSFKRYTKAVMKSLQNKDKDPSEYGLCFDLNSRSIPGKKFLGSYNNEPTTGEVYPFVLGDRFITIVYMRIDKEEPVGSQGWNALIKSLSLGGSSRGAFPSFVNDKESNDGILNGRALKLARPMYSKEDYAARAWGEVEVEVEISEEGKVVYAKAVSGNKILHYNAERAAKMSKFAPTTVCGHPVKVTGTIVYNFVPSWRWNGGK